MWVHEIRLLEWRADRDAAGWIGAATVELPGSIVAQYVLYGFAQNNVWAESWPTATNLKMKMNDQRWQQVIDSSTAVAELVQHLHPEAFSHLGSSFFAQNGR